MDEKPGWLGILQWSLAQKDFTAPSDVPPTRPEDMQWLREAMESMVRDDNKRLREIAKQIADVADGAVPADEDEVLTFLDEAQDICEQIDNGATFVKLGGGRLLLWLAAQRGRRADVRAKAAAVLATCVQNNPQAQELLWRGGALPDMLAALR
ncbi:unnamed protein product, partial [Phaeothamnion confervicola]